jgi:uncharacterized protein YndB with AHSA1/START domain
VTSIGLLEITTPSDREIAMTRVFNAPARLVFDAWTKPELIKRWLGVRAGWTMAVCEVDLRVGGKYRFVWRGPDMTMGMGGLYREVVPPTRLVSTERFDEAWYEGEAVDTMVLVEQDGKTTVTTTVRYVSREVRDAVIKSGMASGVAEGYDKLAELLPSLT